MKHILNIVRGDPETLVWFHKWATLAWIAVTIPMIAFQWYESIAFVAALSLYALAIGHWSSWQAVRVEVLQRQQMEDDAKEKG